MADRIALEVARQVKHDYSNQSVTILGDLEKLQSGKCGHRAALFQKRATEAGLRSRIVIYRGHVANEIWLNGHWKGIDPSIATDEWHEKLLRHIKSGPVYGYSYDWDYLKHCEYLHFELGQYSRWLQLAKSRTNLVLPSQILDRLPLSKSKPNLIIRHDIDSDPEAWMGMVHEEYELGIRSVTYVRTDDETYSFDDCIPILKRFEHEGFEIGLHFNAINRHGMSKKEALSRYSRQLERFESHFPNGRSIQAHGFADDQGIPEYTNYDLEHELGYGFESILQSTGKWRGRIADSDPKSVGIMRPFGVEEYLTRLKRGKLYYALWHPYAYVAQNGWMKFRGALAQRERLTLTRKLKIVGYKTIKILGAEPAYHHLKGHN